MRHAAGQLQELPLRCLSTMSASGANLDAGKRLRAERLRVKLSTRDVEKYSQQIAAARGSQEYCISDTWLAQIENGEFTPSIYKLYSLSRIYKRDYDEILSFFGISFKDLDERSAPISLPRTHLVGPTLRKEGETISVPTELRAKTALEQTNLVHRMFVGWEEIPVSLLRHMASGDTLCGYIGMEDRTLFPLLRPGCFVQIDTHQRKIETNGWHNEFDRPIYFLELRDAYACSWCQLDGSRLTLISSPQSRQPVRQLHYPAEVEIVGRVTAVTMRIADPPGLY